MNKKIEKFIHEVGMKETSNPKLNLYINEKETLEESLKYWEHTLASKGWEVTNFFLDEKRENLLGRKGFNQVIAHYIRGDNAELLVKDLKGLSEDEIEARTIRYMFSQYANATIEVMEEHEDKFLEKHIAELCSSNKNYTYDVGAFDKQKLNKILMYKAKFEMLWHKKCAELEEKEKE